MTRFGDEWAGSELGSDDAALEDAGAVVRTDALRNFRELTLSLGGKPEALLRESRIDPAMLDDRNAVIPYGAMLRLLERAAAELHCQDFGMRLAAIQDSTRVLGPLDIVMRNSPTLRDAFKYCAEHVHAYSTATQISLKKVPRDSRVFMQFEILLPRLPQQRQAVEHALALTQHAIVAISGGRARAREVWFTHDLLTPMSNYRTHLKTLVKFGQAANGLFFDEQDLDLAVPNADPQLHEIATAFIDERFPPAVMRMSTQVRIVIARLLMEGNCTHERVAAELGLQPRTLQRRLREEHESFQTIKDSVRREVALRYLGDADVSLVKLTEILGYSETSVLSRSCHRWFATSPRRLRGERNRET